MLAFVYIGILYLVCVAILYGSAALQRRKEQRERERRQELRNG